MAKTIGQWQRVQSSAISGFPATWVFSSDDAKEAIFKLLLGSMVISKIDVNIQKLTQEFDVNRIAFQQVAESLQIANTTISRINKITGV